jgi:hypothetical protein
MSLKMTHTEYVRIGHRSLSEWDELLTDADRKVSVFGITQVPCGYCGAKPGDWCTTSSGRPARPVHDSRYHAWITFLVALKLGREQGFREAVAAIQTRAKEVFDGDHGRAADVA